MFAPAGPSGRIVRGPCSYIMPFSLRVVATHPPNLNVYHYSFNRINQLQPKLTTIFSDIFHFSDDVNLPVGSFNYYNSIYIWFL